MGAKAVSNLGELFNLSCICSSTTEETALLSIKSEAYLKNTAWIVLLSIWISLILGKKKPASKQNFISVSLEIKKYGCQEENRQEEMMKSRKGNWGKSPSHHPHTHIRWLTIIYEVTSLWIINYRAMTLWVLVFHQWCVYVSRLASPAVWRVNVYQGSTKVFLSVCLSFRIWEEKENIVRMQWELSHTAWRRPGGSAVHVSTRPGEEWVGICFVDPAALWECHC